MTTTPRELADSFHERWLAANPFAASIYGIPGYDDLMPDASEAGDTAWRAYVESVLEEARGVDVATLAPADVVTLGCVINEVERELLDLDSAAVEHTVTAMPFAGPPGLLAVAARTVLTDADACADYVSRLRRSGEWLDAITERARSGAAKGRLPVASLVEQAIGWAEAVLSEPVPAAFRAPEPPANWADADGWRADRDDVVRDTVVPAMGRWVELLRELLPQARPDDRSGLA